MSDKATENWNAALHEMAINTMDELREARDYWQKDAELHAADVIRLTKANAELREAAAEYLEVCPVLRTHPIGAPNSKARERQAREIQSADKLIVALDNSSEGE